MPRRLGKDPEIYNIPAHLSFVDQLAEGIMERYGSDPLTLSEVLILLPNRRAVRSLRDAFLRLGEGRSIILPNMQPIGDVDEDGLIMGAGGLYDDLSVKPAVPPLERRIILMNIIHSWYKKKKKEIPENATCAVLAEALGHLLDQVQTEEIDFNDLEGIVPEEYAEHWQQTIEFLEILTDRWPDTLSSLGFMDSAIRRNNLLSTLRQKWLENPPDHPIIAAGSTGSIRSTARLLEVIARLPQGMVILPGLDRNMDDESWQEIEDTHPQATMKHLLEVIAADRIEVENWDGSDAYAEHKKTLLFREIMRPAKTTHLWRELKPDFQKNIENIRQVVTPGMREEAGIIALMMREQLNQAGSTAALVTQDRTLARQVAGELKRWNIHIDDSAGFALFNTAPGVYLRLLSEMVAEKMAPVALISALKHPLMSGGIKKGDFRTNVRKFEHKFLRGPRPAPGLEGIEQVLTHESESGDQFSAWWAELSDIIRPFYDLMHSEDASFEEMLVSHVEMAEKLAQSDEVAGAKQLWKGDAGEAAANLIEELRSAAGTLRHFKPAQYGALFEQFMNTVTVRPKYGLHPRLNIWGSLEARLQHADLMILSGLNEGSWPPEPSADPWMSRPMRKDFGLPGLEQRIGLSAHDFVQTASAKNVVITRSEKQDGTPTVKSRWLNRLHAIAGDDHHKAESAKWLSWYQELDRPSEIKPVKPPEPRPPVKTRPRDLSVTRIQLWMQDPYSLYASKILRLKKLDELDQDPGALDKGIIIHNILEEFMAEFRDILPDDAEPRLIEIGRKYFKEKIDRPTVRAFWWPRFKQIAKWFIAEERERRELIKTVATETEGEIKFDTAGGEFKLSARADRIDQFLDDKSLSIIDYKTGNVPSLRQLKTGYAPQLPLEGAIAVKGGFSLLPSSLVSEFSYWKLSGGIPAGEMKIFRDKKTEKTEFNVMEEVQKSYEGLVKLVTTFDILETPYLSNPNPAEKGYGEFDHLARTKEWGDG